MKINFQHTQMQYGWKYVIIIISLHGLGESLAQDPNVVVSPSSSWSIYVLCCPGLSPLGSVRLLWKYVTCNTDVRFVVLTAKIIETAAFRDVAPCNIADIDRRFRDFVTSIIGVVCKLL
jgi:hypothetical protein